MLSFPEIKKQVIRELTSKLSPDLTYHNVDHTLDILKQAELIAGKEGITNAEDLLLIKISALYHDIGFINVYSGHEEESCRIARPELESFGFGPSQIEKVMGMIRATKVPQQPNNLMEQILCDSDLDYLGRNDFFSIGEGLYKEFLLKKIVSSYQDWNLLQIRFLEKHHYFTKSSMQRRQKQKEVHYEVIKAKVGMSV
jgi:predicted metal-dependent HD superfamily phosphohydrolase